MAARKHQTKLHKDNTELMSDTPRTDAVEDWSSKFKGCKVVPNWKSHALERELNAANARIKRLEEAGDLIIIWLLHNRSHLGGLDVDSALVEWKTAKKETIEVALQHCLNDHTAEPT